MRSITRMQLRTLNGENYMPVELLDIQPPGASDASTIRLTDAGEALTWNANAYTPVAMAHGDIQDMMAADGQTVPAISMTIQNVDLQMAALLSTHEVEGSWVTLRQCDRRLLSNPRDAMILTQGELRNPQLSEQTLAFQILNAIGLTEKIMVPRRLFQPECNYGFGSRACGVNLHDSRFTLLTTAQAGTSRDHIVVPAGIISAAGALTPTEFWANGYILCLSGSAMLQSRPIQQVAGNTFYTRYGFLSDPDVGCTMLIRRGCGKTKEDCVARQGNALNFGGFEGVPYGRIVPVVVDH